jgi:hypothetical protein
MSIFDLVKNKVYAISPTRLLSSNERIEPQKSEKIDVAAILMSKNRKERRQFKKQHGIFLHGSTKPIVNAPKGKHKEM